MKELQPVNENVLLEIIEEREAVSRGGIIIPDTAKEKPMFAKVVSMSQIENAEVAVGDTIFYKAYSGSEIEHEGKKFLVLPYADILAKLVETDKI